jgi:hypothetical protein
MAKPSKLTPALRNQMVDLLESGQRFEAACDLCGITYQTHRNWMTRGEVEAHRLTDPKAKARKDETPYLEYFDAIKRATAHAEVDNVKSIIDASKGGQEVQTQTIEKFDKDGNLKERKVVTQLAPPQWTAAAWFLERRLPAEYGKRDVLKIETEVRQQLEQLLAALRNELSPGAYGEVERFVAERLGDGDQGKLPN